jgi:hypothetical protein
MDAVMKDNGRIMKCMGRACLDGKMDADMKDHIDKI